MPSIPPAGNDEVRKVFETFAGKGQLSDGSELTSAEESLSRFRLAPGFKIELVASEPQITQPLFMTFDEFGRMWVVQYRQYPFPAGLKVLRYDQYLRAVFDRVPAAPPNHVRGKDVIGYFEDSDSDGRYDNFREVIDGLNISTSVAIASDGLWVLNPPYLLHYEDRDGDCLPDAAPVVHLKGFGLEDTHSVANSLRWGPDGWLYGANGSTTTASIETKRGQQTNFEGQCIWRYHPRKEVFEIYAEGGGNTFSTEIDSIGQVFSGTNNGNTRGMYYPQGSYSEKNWGKHGPLTNPFAFGYFDHMRFEGDADRFAQTFAIYEGGAFPEEYRGRIIAANALHNRVWVSELLPDTSSYRTIDHEPLLETDDRWFRPVDVKVGPDGAIYVADWCDSRLSHVDPRDDWHKASGRIYRIAYDESSASHRVITEAAQNARASIPTPTHFNLRSWTSDALISLFDHPNRFFQQTAVRVLAERNDPTCLPRLRELIRAEASHRSLLALWTIYQCQAIDDELWLDCLSHPVHDVRRWSIRLLGDDRYASPRLTARLQQLARSEPNLHVRTQLASSAKRFDSSTALPIIRTLLERDEDHQDLHQGMLLWWAIEAHCDSQREAIFEWWHDVSLWHRPMVETWILSRLMQRFATTASDRDWDFCLRLLQLAPTDNHKRLLFDGLNAALAGRSDVAMPAALRQELSGFFSDKPHADIAVKLRIGDDSAEKLAIEIVRDASQTMSARLELIEVLGELHSEKLVPVLLKLLQESSSPAIQRVSLTTLGRYSDTNIGATICKLLQTSLPAADDVQRVAVGVLASRAVWAKQLLDEVESGRLRRATIPADVIQQLASLSDDGLQERISRIWGRIRQTPDELNAEIDSVYQTIQPGKGDRAHGKELFRQKCGVCHKLFGEGGETGPDLTGYERTNLKFLVPSIVAPSSAIREEFTTFQVLTHDDRLLTGLLVSQDANLVTLRAADNSLARIARSDVATLRATPISLMPEGLLRGLSNQDIQDLFAYLTAKQ